MNPVLNNQKYFFHCKTCKTYIAWTGPQTHKQISDNHQEVCKKLANKGGDSNG